MTLAGGVGPEPLRIQIAFFENGAGFGGAVTCLATLIGNLDQSRFGAVVLSSHDDAASRAAIEAAGGRFLHVRQYRRSRRLGTMVGSLGRRPSVLRYPILVLVLLYEMLRRTIHALAAYRVLVRQGIHLVHLNNSAAGNIEGVLAAKLRRLRCVQHVRAFEDDAPESRFAARRVDRFLAMSESVAGSLTSMGVPRERIQILYEGIDLEQCRNRSVETSSSAFTFGSCNVGIVGVLTPWKGQRVFIEAASILAREATMADCRFFVIGGTVPGGEDYLRELETLARARGLGDRMVFAGHQDNVFTFLSRLDVVVHASLSPEPFGRVILEAMALAKPVIATRMGGPLEIIEHERDGLLIRANDPEELAAAIRGLIADPSRRRRIAEQARRTVESRFTMIRFAEELQQVYLDLSLDVRRRNGL